MGYDPLDRPGDPAVPADPVELDRRVRSLSRWLAVLTALTLVALGIAVLLLVTDNGDDASSERVARLDDRLDRLERRVARASEESDAVRLQRELEGKADESDVQQLEQDVKDLRDVVAETSSRANATADDVDQLDRRVTRLETQVEELSAQSGGAP